MSRHWKEQLTDESGGTLAMVGVCLILFLSVAALAVDLGMLFDSRTEAQRTADAAALAGAAAFMPPPIPRDQQRDTAESWARNWSLLNPVRNESVLPENVQVDVIMDSLKVRVALQRREIPTWFARIFGREAADVGARAAAQGVMSGRAGCLKPFMVVDAWDDRNKDGKYDPGELYDPIVTGWGTSFRDNDGSGYRNDVGRPVVLKRGQFSAAMQPGWYYTIRLGDDTGASDLRAQIAAVECNPTLLDVGDFVRSEDGAMPNVVMWGVQDLIATDPDARWENNGIVNSAFGPGGNGSGSPRIINLPLTDPTKILHSSTKDYEITNFAAIFLERVVDTGPASARFIEGRWMTLRGVPDNCVERNNCRPNLIYLRLVE
jgi:hypothetical protein